MYGSYFLGETGYGMMPLFGGLGPVVVANLFSVEALEQEDLTTIFLGD